jgi:hypothetical protein
MDLIERIGPVLGIVAFLGFSALVFLLFQQGREVRRLREWAGRAPERAREAAEASLAAAEARDEGPVEETIPASGPEGRLARLWGRVTSWTAARWRAFDRRLPVAGRYVVGAVGVLLIAVVLLAGGFGVFGDDGDDGRRKDADETGPTVAVLNGTTVEGIQGVPQLAARVAEDVVRPAGYDSGPVTDTSSSFDNSVVMYRSGDEAEARALAIAIAPQLGDTSTQPMTSEVESLSRNASLALVIGLDDSRFGAAAG